MYVFYLLNNFFQHQWYKRIRCRQFFLRMHSRRISLAQRRPVRRKVATMIELSRETRSNARPALMVDDRTHIGQPRRPPPETAGRHHHSATANQQCQIHSSALVQGQHHRRWLAVGHGNKTGSRLDNGIRAGSGSDKPFAQNIAAPLRIVGGHDQLDSAQLRGDVVDGVVDKAPVGDRQTVLGPVPVQKVAASDVQTHANEGTTNPIHRSTAFQNVASCGVNFRSKSKHSSQVGRYGVGVAISLIESTESNRAVRVPPQSCQAFVRVQTRVAMVPTDP